MVAAAEVQCDDRPRLFGTASQLNVPIHPRVVRSTTQRLPPAPVRAVPTRDLARDSSVASSARVTPLS